MSTSCEVPPRGVVIPTDEQVSILHNTIAPEFKELICAARPGRSPTGQGNPHHLVAPLNPRLTLESQASGHDLPDVRIQAHSRVRGGDLDMLHLG